MFMVLRVIGLALAVGAAYYWARDLDRPESVDFFTTSAQVIPVLILAILVEGSPTLLKNIPVALMVGMLTGAELVALDAIASGDWSTGQARLIYGAIAAGFVSLVMFTVASAAEERNERG